MPRLLLVLLLAAAGCSALCVPAPLGPARDAAPPAPPLEVAWRLDAGGAFGRSPAVATSGGALVTTRRGDVVLVDASGRRQGSVSVGSAVEGRVALVDGRILVVGADGGRHGVVALDLLAGSRRWRALRDVEVHAGVVVASGVVVAPALDGVVYGLDLGTGEIRWQTPARPHSAYRAAPVVLPQGDVLVSTSLGRLDALDPATGDPSWTIEIGAPVEEDPVVGDGTLLVPTTRGRLVALDPSSGAERWALAADRASSRFSSPAVVAGAIYAGESGGALYRLAADGSVVWRRETDGYVAAAPLVAGGFVYAGTLDERLVVLEAETGAERWSHTFDGRVKSTPTLLGGLVLVPSEPGHVWAFRTAGHAGPTP